MKGCKRGDLVLIEWADAVVEQAGWEKHDKAPRPEVVHSVGIVIHSPNASVTLAADFDPEKKGKADVNRTITIPAGWVRKVKTLR